MTALDSLVVDLTVVLGKTRIPLHRLLRMGRGAVLGLGTRDDDHVDVLANGHPIAKGRVVVRDGRVGVEVLRLVRKGSVDRAPGARIGGEIVAQSAVG